MIGQTFAIIGSLIGALILQSFWINRSLGRVEKRVDQLAEQADKRFDSIEDVLLKDHGQRIAKLEERITR